MWNGFTYTFDGYQMWDQMNNNFYFTFDAHQMWSQMWDDFAYTIRFYPKIIN